MNGPSGSYYPADDGTSSTLLELAREEFNPSNISTHRIHLLTCQHTRLLISGIIPRPIGFVSTCNDTNTSTNLAPFSYFQVINHDPPIFVLGFSGGLDRAKDTLDNLAATNECTLNIISEEFIEAANACAIDLPFGQSEWSVSGLTPAETSVVRPKRVLESVFSIEAKLLSTQEFQSRREKDKVTGTLAIVEGVVSVSELYML